MKIEKTLTILYKTDGRGLLRQWFMEIGEHPEGVYWHRSVYGRVGGKNHATEWTLAEPKNIGKSNATDSKAQAYAEVKAMYLKKREQEGYSENPRQTKVESIKPMLAKVYEDHSHKIWTPGQVVCVQPKLDGIRCIATPDGLMTRKGKPIAACPHIEKAVKELFKLYPSAKFFDGELYNHKLRHDFQKITSVVRKTKPSADDIKESEDLIEYHIYDLGRDDSFVNRFLNFAIHVTDSLPKHIKLVKTEPVPDVKLLDQKYKEYMDKGYEGMMVRWGNDPYEMKRTDKLLKRKSFDAEEVEVITIEEGSGDWSGAAKKFICKYIDGKIFSAGVTGDYDTLSKLWHSGDCPDWATVQYFGVSNEGIPRFPVVIDYGYNERED